MFHSLFRQPAPVSVHHLSRSSASSCVVINPISVSHLLSVTVLLGDIYNHVVVVVAPPSFRYIVLLSVPVHPVAASFQFPMFTSCVDP